MRAIKCVIVLLLMPLPAFTQATCPSTGSPSALRSCISAMTPGSWALLTQININTSHLSAGPGGRKSYAYSAAWDRKRDRCWAAWAVLWLCFFAIGVLRRPAWTRPVAWLTLVQSVGTAWLPGYLLLTGRIAA